MFRPIYGTGRRVIRSAPKGFPDLIGVQRRQVQVRDVVNPNSFQPHERLRDMAFGQAIAIETKTVRGRQSPEQKDFQAEWERIGGIYILARNVDDVLAVLGPDSPAG